MQVDYLILGQGICGTMLSYSLLQKGASILVIDNAQPAAASRVASGLINPVTGKRYVQSWMIEQLIPAALNTYRALEKQLQVSLIKEISVFDFFQTPQTQQQFADRTEQLEYLYTVNNEGAWQLFFHFNYGIGEVVPCYLVDLQVLLGRWRQYLSSNNLLVAATFDWKDCAVLADKVVYKDIIAHKIICCEGAAGYDNPYFSSLPYTANKGEAIIASIPELPRAYIYQQGIKIVPWQDELFWIGSSFEWDFADNKPTEKFRLQTEAHLKNWLKLPYTIEDHFAATRPTTMGYKPFVGLHPLQTSVGVLNGMGTKGCSLAPYFAQQMTEYLLEGKPILPEADVKRFTRILSK